jgi:hypothetical protein
MIPMSKITRQFLVTARWHPETNENNQKLLQGVQGPTAWGGEAGAFAPSSESLNCDSQLPARCSVLETPLRAKSQELRANLKSPPGRRRQGIIHD